MSKSLVTMKLSRPRVLNELIKKQGISFVSNQEWPPVFLQFSCWISICNHEGVLCFFSTDFVQELLFPVGWENNDKAIQ